MKKGQDCTNEIAFIFFIFGMSVVAFDEMSVIAFWDECSSIFLHFLYEKMKMRDFLSDIPPKSS